MTHFRLLHPYLGGMRLGDIDIRVIKRFIKDRQDQGRKPATIDRTLALLKAVLNKARAEDWIEQVPTITLFHPDNEITRFITKAEARKLIGASPEWLADLIAFSLSTGLRESDVLNFEWRRVDLERKHAWVEKMTTKGVKSIPVPINDDAWQVLLKQVGKHPQYLFTEDGELIKKVNRTEWEHAKRRAGIKNFRWHDLRHTWASWHVQSGTPLPVLMEIGGWSNMDMVLRYAHLRGDDLAKHKNNVLLEPAQWKMNTATVCELFTEDGPKPALDVAAQIESAALLLPTMMGQPVQSQPWMHISASNGV